MQNYSTAVEYHHGNFQKKLQNRQTFKLLDTYPLCTFIVNNTWRRNEAYHVIKYCICQNVSIMYSVHVWMFWKSQMKQ